MLEGHLYVVACNRRVVEAEEKYTNTKNLDALGHLACNPSAHHSIILVGMHSAQYTLQNAYMRGNITPGILGSGPRAPIIPRLMASTS